jgi:hypothetical protein
MVRAGLSVEAKANESAVSMMRPPTTTRGTTRRMQKRPDVSILRIDASNHRLRRVGRLARRRMRIDADHLRNGTHTDGTLSIEIAGLEPSGRASAPAPNQPDGSAIFAWRSNRPVALVIVRSGSDGEDVSFRTGPLEAGVIDPATLRKGGIRYIAFCYDTEPDSVPTAAGTGDAPASILAQLLRAGSPA